jgi:hypothetical protein
LSGNFRLVPFNLMRTNPRYWTEDYEWSHDTGREALWKRNERRVSLEKFRMYDRLRYSQDPEQKKKSSKNWRESHKLEHLKQNEKWRDQNPGLYRLQVHRHNVSRRDNVPQIEVVLNKHFDGAELHHTGRFDGKQVGIWVPKSLHQSIRHNLATSRGLEKINIEALAYMGSQI